MIFAGGCFGVSRMLRRGRQVTETVSGYAGGTKPNPTYGDHEGYQEAVQVTYDPAKVITPTTCSTPIGTISTRSTQTVSSAITATPIAA